jgi:alkylation response protein AidB-like acyl-CoA dehydrogenase
MIRADADAADGRASLGQASFERMRSEGLFHLLVPPELGVARQPRQWFVALAVAHADASAGWMPPAAVQNAWLAVASDDRFARSTPLGRRSPPAARRA